MTPELLKEANALQEAINYMDKVLSMLGGDKTPTHLVFRESEYKITVLDLTIFSSKIGPLDTDLLSIFKESLLRRKAKFEYELGKLPEARDFNDNDFNNLDFNAN